MNILNTENTKYKELLLEVGLIVAHQVLRVKKDARRFSIAESLIESEREGLTNYLSSIK